MKKEERNISISFPAENTEECIYGLQQSIKEIKKRQSIKLIFVGLASIALIAAMADIITGLGALKGITFCCLLFFIGYHSSTIISIENSIAQLKDLINGLKQIKEEQKTTNDN